MKIVDAKVIVTSPGRNFVTLKLTTDDKGEARFTPSKSGAYGVRALVEHQRSGTHNGKPYNLVKDYTTIVLPITTP